MAISSSDCARALAALRRKRPLVHNITNMVAMDISANLLLALGASPAMIMAPEEVEDFALLADALVANIGTLSTSSLTAMRRAATVMAQEGKPWVFDPVGCGAAAFRLAAAQGLLGLAPTVVRGNPGEIASLAGVMDRTSRGVDTLVTSGAGVAHAVALSEATGGVVVITGETDFAVHGSVTIRVEGGCALMPLVTGVGCALSAATAAFLAVEPDPLLASVSALATFAVAGRRAGREAAGPGSFRVAFLDALHSLTPDELAGEAEIADA